MNGKVTVKGEDSEKIVPVPKYAPTPIIVF